MREVLGKYGKSGSGSEVEEGFLRLESCAGALMPASSQH